MTRRSWPSVLAFIAAAIALAVPAFADHTNQPDPNDTSGRLDLRAVRFDHEGPPRWTFVTFGRWTLAQIWDHGYLLVELDTRGDEAIDHLALVRSDGRHLRATLYRIRSDGRQAEIGTLPTDKAGARSAWVSVALRKLSIGRSRTSYFWAALSSYTGDACPRTCFDRAPDAEMVEQPLPGVTPTPTPSPTPSPSPSPSP